MAVRDHLRPGLTDKMRVKILTVDPSSMRVEAALKDGAMIQVAVWDTPNAFRWPVENETWIVRRDGGIWMLAHRVEASNATEALPLSTMSPGQMKLDATQIYDANGNLLSTAVSSSSPHLGLHGSLAIVYAGATKHLVHL